MIAGLAQCGGKQAHRMGMDNVSFDETLSALAYNLRRLGGGAQAKPPGGPPSGGGGRCFLVPCAIQPRARLGPAMADPRGPAGCLSQGKAAWAPLPCG